MLHRSKLSVKSPPHSSNQFVGILAKMMKNSLGEAARLLFCLVEDDSKPRVWTNFSYISLGSIFHSDWKQRRSYVILGTIMLLLGMVAVAIVCSPSPQCIQKRLDSWLAAIIVVKNRGDESGEIFSCSTEAWHKPGSTVWQLSSSGWPISQFCYAWTNGRPICALIKNKLLLHKKYALASDFYSFAKASYSVLWNTKLLFFISMVVCAAGLWWSIIGATK